MRGNRSASIESIPGQVEPGGGVSRTEARAKAWETRRAKYGPQGHNGYRLRPVRRAGPGDLLISISCIGGYCPVQAEGMVNGREFYFRARHSSWRMNIGGDVVLRPSWTYAESYGDGPHDAGYMSEAEARVFIAKACALWANADTTGRQANPREAI